MITPRFSESWLPKTVSAVVTAALFAFSTATWTLGVRACPHHGSGHDSAPVESSSMPGHGAEAPSQSQSGNGSGGCSCGNSSTCNTGSVLSDADIEKAEIPVFAHFTSRVSEKAHDVSPKKSTQLRLPFANAPPA